MRVAHGKRGDVIAKKAATIAIVAIAFFVAGKQYAGLFGCNNKVADMVATGFKIYAVTFLAMGYNVVKRPSQ